MVGPNISENNDTYTRGKATIQYLFTTIHYTTSAFLLHSEMKNSTTNEIVIYKHQPHFIFDKHVT